MIPILRLVTALVLLTSLPAMAQIDRGGIASVEGVRVETSDAISNRVLSWMKAFQPRTLSELLALGRDDFDDVYLLYEEGERDSAGKPTVSVRFLWRKNRPGMLTPMQAEGGVVILSERPLASEPPEGSLAFRVSPQTMGQVLGKLR